MLTEQCRDRCQCCEPSGGVVEGMGRQRPRLIDPRGSNIRGQAGRPHKLIDGLTDWGGRLIRRQASSVQTGDHIAFAVQWKVSQPPPDCDYLGGKGRPQFVMLGSCPVHRLQGCRYRRPARVRQRRRLSQLGLAIGTHSDEQA